MAKKQSAEELKEKIDALERAIREQKKTGEDLRRQAVKLEGECEALKQVVAHGLRNLREPMDVVSNYLRFVDARYGDRLDPDANAFIASAVHGMGEMERIVAELSALVNG